MIDYSQDTLSIPNDDIEYHTALYQKYLIFYREIENQYGNLEKYFADPDKLTIEEFYKGYHYV